MGLDLRIPSRFHGAMSRRDDTVLVLNSTPPWIVAILLGIIAFGLAFSLGFGLQDELTLFSRTRSGSVSGGATAVVPGWIIGLQIFLFLCLPFLLGLGQQSLRTSVINGKERLITIRPLHPLNIGARRIPFDDIASVEIDPAPPVFLARFAKNPAPTQHIPVLHLKDGTTAVLSDKRTRANNLVYRVKQITALIAP